MKKTILILLILGFVGGAATSQDTNKNLNLSGNHLAVDGYDVVCYQTQKKPVEGKKTFSYSYAGATYYFASQQNLNLFKSDPEKYIPAYGGWCAYAMGDSGEKVKVDPETFKIINGKLYLFYNFFFNNTLEKWNENEKELKSKADTNWKKITQTK